MVCADLGTDAQWLEIEEQMPPLAASLKRTLFMGVITSLTRLSCAPQHATVGSGTPSHAATPGMLPTAGALPGKSCGSFEHF